MKKYLLFVILIFNYLIGSEEKDFLSLSNVIEKNYSEKKYNEALKNLNDIKKIIEDSKEKSLVTTTNSDFDILLKQSKSPAELKIEDDKIEIIYGANILYTTQLKNDKSSSYKLEQNNKYIMWLKYENQYLTQNKYVKIKDKTKKIEFKSSDERLLRVDDSGGFVVKGTGDIVITISVDDNFVLIPLRIIEVPINYGMSTDQIIANLGLPDKINKEYVDTFESKTVDGIFYYSNGEYHSVLHWLYNSYPDMVLSPYEKRVYTSSWEKIRNLGI